MAIVSIVKQVLVVRVIAYLFRNPALAIVRFLPLSSQLDQRVEIADLWIASVIDPMIGLQGPE